MESILQAAEMNLYEQELENFNTRKISDKAGVSIGSFYDYFSNKESLLATLIDRRIQREMNMCRQYLHTHRHLPVRETFPQFISLLIDVYDNFSFLDRQLLKAMAYIGYHDPLIKAEEEVIGWLAQYFSEHKDEWRSNDYWLDAFIMQQSIHNCIHSAVLRHPHLLKSQAFKDSLAKLILGYLK